jgi:hypothetical protein
VVEKESSEIRPGERSDVSWISPGAPGPDRQKEVVIPKGMNDSQVQGNPQVTVQHNYQLPPVGRSLWRKVARDDDLRGVTAKTLYPQRPESWPREDTWPPDKASALVQAALLQGKSIGFLPTKVHLPTQQEIKKSGWGEDTRCVIDEWILLEYAATFLPVNQAAQVEAVSKGTIDLPEELLRAIGQDWNVIKPELPAELKIAAFTPLSEVHRAIERSLTAGDFGKLGEKCLREAIDRARGRV